MHKWLGFMHKYMFFFALPEFFCSQQPNKKLLFILFYTHLFVSLQRVDERRCKKAFVT